MRDISRDDEEKVIEKFDIANVRDDIAEIIRQAESKFETETEEDRDDRIAIIEDIR